MKMSPFAGFCVLLCLPLCNMSAEGAQDSARPVALVYWLQGEATLTVPSEERRPLRLFDRLPAGATVEAGPGSRVALAFANGRRYELGERSRATLGRADLSLRSGPVRALRSVPPLPRLLPIVDEEQPGRIAGSVRIRAERIKGLYPHCGAAALAGATVLRFEPVEGIGKYGIEVHDRQGNVIFATETAASRVNIPAGHLRPGLRYHWTIRTVDRVGPVAKGEADFVTLPAELAEKRETLRKSTEKAGDGESLALLAGVDRSLGMLIEARDGLRAAVGKSPGNACLTEELATVERQLKDEVVLPEPQGASGAVQILHTWGEMLRQRGADDRARVYFRLALRLAPEGSLAAARELSALGNIARRQGNLAAAQDFLQQAYSIREKLAPGSLDHASSVGDLAVVAAIRGDVVAAEEGFAKALELQQRLAPGGMEVAGTLINLGVILEKRSDFAGAEEHYRRAITMIERRSPNHLELARALSALGHSEMYRGDLAGAEEHFRRSLAIRQKIAPETLHVAGSLRNLGLIAEKRGDLAAAEEHHRRALEICEKLAPGSPDASEMLANLGSTERRRGNLVKADEYLRRALEIEDRNSSDRPATTQMRIERAMVAVERGDLALAEELYGRALSWLDKRYPESMGISDVLEGLGEIAFERGDLAKAEELFRRTVAIREKLAPGSTRLGMSLNNLARVHRREGRLAMAAESFCRATEVFDQQRKKLGGPMEGRSAFGGTTAEPYHECLAALIDNGRPEEAFRILERGRARSFLDLLAERDLRWTADLPPELALERKQVDAEYDRTQAALARLSPVRSAAEGDRLLVRLRELRARQEEIVAKVRQASPRNATLRDPQPFDLAAARNALDPGTLLVAWSIGRDRSFLFVIDSAKTGGPGLEVFPLSLGDQHLRQRVKAFRNLLQRADSDSEALARKARELYDLLLRPADARIAAAARVLLSPDGPLHTLPFAALVRDDRFLAEQKPAHTVSSATVYAELKKSRRAGAPSRRMEIAAFGDPSYPPISAGQSSAAHPEVRAALGRGLELTPLPATRDEVRGIAALYPEARTFLGRNATEEHAKSIGSGARYLHFACHGLLDERFPLNSSLALAIPDHPGEGQDNGLLQAWEIFERVRLDADLVTLSACDSAMGSEMGGEGLLGLTRAFQYAGARSVLASLWSVSDLSTADLMKRFYGQLRAGKAKDEALQAAQAALIRSKEFSHPYYWAAFQLVGDWK